MKLSDGKRGQGKPPVRNTAVDVLADVVGKSGNSGIKEAVKAADTPAAEIMAERLPEREDDEEDEDVEIEDEEDGEDDDDE